MTRMTNHERVALSRIAKDIAHQCGKMDKAVAEDFLLEMIAFCIHQVDMTDEEKQAYIEYMTENEDIETCTECWRKKTKSKEEAANG